jgi:hypothetical protein
LTFLWYANLWGKISRTGLSVVVFRKFRQLDAKIDPDDERLTRVDEYLCWGGRSAKQKEDKRMVSGSYRIDYHVSEKNDDVEKVGM